MIQPAALPATAVPSLGAALQIGQADESGVPGGFADLLASTLNGDTPPSPAADKIPPEALAAGMVAARQVPGKVAGKTLPDELPVAEEAPAEDEAVTESVDGADAAPMAPVPFSLAMLNAIVLPQPESEAPVAASTHIAVAPAEARLPKGGAEPTPAAETQQPKVDTAPVAALPTASLTLALPESKRIAQRLEVQSAENTDAKPVSEAKPAALQPAVPAIALQAAGTAVAPKAATLRADERKVEDEALAKGAVATPASTAETLRQRPAHAGEVAAAAPRAAIAGASDTTASAAGDPIAQVGAELQPMIALRDAPASPATSINAGPAAPAALAERGHDFAALVDRLVEAREAASPQTVSAAIRHAEFGQVSLRFDQGDNGLSVAMTSIDPDFARAVQAASPAGQTATSDNGNNGGSSSSQQSAGNASAQTQSQSQSSTRDGQTAQTREETGRTPASRRKADEGEQPASTRDGIYA